MPTPQQIDEFRKKARANGYSELDIANEISRKIQEEARSTVNPNNQQQQPTTQPNTQITTKRKKGAVEKVSDFLLPRITQFSRDAIGSYKLGQRVGEIEKTNVELQKRSLELAKQAKKESNPQKKEQLLAESRRLSQEASGNIDQMLGDFHQDTGIDLNRSYEEQRGSYGTQVAGVAGEAATWLIPASKVIKGAGFVAKVINTTITGATAGGIYGLTKPQDLTVGERLKEGATSAATGAVISGGMTAATEPFRQVAKNFVMGNKDRIYRLFRISPSERAKFRKSTGNMDFAEEILTRDGKEIAGKSYEELLTYFGDRKKQAIEDVATTLKGKEGTINKKIIEDKINSIQVSLSPQQGNVGQDGARAALNKILEELKDNPEELTLEVANRIKQQLQEAGEAAFSPNGKASPTSSQLAKVSSFVKEQIEKVLPDIKEKNSLIQLYSQAKTAIEKTGDREANKISNDVIQKFLQTLPGAIGAGAGLMTGNPYNGFYGFVGATILSGAIGAGRVKYFTPEFQTGLIKSLEPIARSQGIKNADKFAQRIAQEFRQMIVRQATKGTETPSSPTPTTQLPPTTGQVPTDTPTPPPSAESGQTVQIRNKKTGEVRTVSKSELNTFGLGTGEKGVSGIPSKEQILAAMFLDVEKTGGKNLSTLNTLLTAYDKVSGGNLSANDKAAISDAATGLNLVAEIEDSYQELQDMGITAQDGGLKERAAGAARGAWTAIKQEGMEGAKAAAYADAVDSFMSRIARAAGEKGVLTDGDIKRIRKSIPRFSDSPLTAQEKFTKIKSIISSAIEARKRNPKELLGE